MISIYRFGLTFSRQKINKKSLMLNYQSHVSSYSYGHDEQLGKDVVNYIKMVDEYNKQNNIFLQAQKKKSA
jgi:hypothetical protein